MSDTYTSVASRSTLLERPYFGSRWIRFGLSMPRPALPPLPCCYCVYSNNELIYIGQTNNLRERFAYHSGRKKFTGDLYLKVKFGIKYGDWAMWELRLIRRLHPPMNRRIV